MWEKVLEAVENFKSIELVKVDKKEVFLNGAEGARIDLDVIPESLTVFKLLSTKFEINKINISVNGADFSLEDSIFALPPRETLDKAIDIWIGADTKNVLKKQREDRVNKKFKELMNYHNSVLEEQKKRTSNEEKEPVQ